MSLRPHNPYGSKSRGRTHENTLTVYAPEFTRSLTQRRSSSFLCRDRFALKVRVRPVCLLICRADVALRLSRLLQPALSVGESLN